MATTRKVSDQQKTAFDAKVKQDLSDLGIAAATGLGRFLDANPNNTVSKIAQQPFVKGLLVMAAEAAKAERAKAEAEQNAKNGVVDTEIVDEEKRRT
jgi:hypothetical protein